MPEARIPSLGLGCMGLNWAYGPADRDESLATVRHALDLGVTFLDTADVYANGENERLVGEAIAGRRGEVTLATKFGIQTDPGTGYPNGQVDGSPEYVRRSIDGSLQRLGAAREHGMGLDALDENLALVEQVREVAERRGATPAQVALAWLLAQGDDVVPIPGTERRTYLEENLGARDVALDADDVTALSALSALVPTGNRTGDMSWVNRDTAARS